MNILKSLLQKGDDSSEFLPLLAEIENTPLNPLGRTMFWIIVLLISFTILWLYFGKADIVVSARGKVIPDGEIKILQPLDTGVIENILVKEGDFVRKGQILIEIDSSETTPEIEALQKNLQYIKTENERLNSVADNKQYNNPEAITQQKLYESSLNDLKNQLSAKDMEIEQINAQLNSTNSEIKNYEHLLKTGKEKEQRMYNVIDIIAYSEFEKVRSENFTFSTNISTLKQKLNELSFKKQQILQEKNYLISNFKTQNLSQLSENEKREVSMISDIDKLKFKKQKQSITAPVDGYINTLLVHTIGGVVTPAKEILSIVPINTPLTLKVNVLNKDIGFVKQGMPVQIKIDTFDFQKYGMIEGIVTKIPKDSIEDKDLGLIYEVLITPLTTSLDIDGSEQKISSGMSLSAEIKVGKRRIIEFFIYPIIKYWSEAISIK